MARNISAVILAAGLSSRMKAFKPLLPCPDISGRSPALSVTMVERVISLFSHNRIRDIVVVTGHRQEELAPVVRKAGAVPVCNPDYPRGMLTSIQTGFRHIDPASRGAFLLPVDIPAIRLSTVRHLIQVSEKNPDQVIMPCFDKKPGHPPLIPSSLIPAILKLDRSCSLRDLLHDPGTRLVNAAVCDQGVLMDTDTPDAYAAVSRKLASITCPGKEECRAMARAVLNGTDSSSVMAHMAAVCEAALTLARAVDRSSPDALNRDLIQAASLVHDMYRNQGGHARKGAAFMRKLGFETVADIVACHMDLDLDSEPADRPVTEAQVVYFADKLCRGDRLDLNYRTRFLEKMEKYPHAEQQIRKRYETACRIHARIEALTGQSITAIFG